MCKMVHNIESAHILKVHNIIFTQGAKNTNFKLFLCNIVSILCKNYAHFSDSAIRERFVQFHIKLCTESYKHKILERFRNINIFFKLSIK